MATLYFIGPTSSKGSYYFYSKQLQGWVVADLDLGKASFHDKIATLEIEPYANCESKLTRVALGQNERKYLIDGDSLLLLLRDYSEEIKPLMVYYADGTELPYGKTEQAAAQVLRECRRRSGR